MLFFSKKFCLDTFRFCFVFLGTAVTDIFPCGLMHFTRVHQRSLQTHARTSNLQPCPLKEAPAISRYLLNAPDIDGKCHAQEVFFATYLIVIKPRRPQKCHFIVLWAKFVQNANTTLLPGTVPALGVPTRDWQPVPPIWRECCQIDQ